MDLSQGQISAFRSLGLDAQNALLELLAVAKQIAPNPGPVGLTAPAANDIPITHETVLLTTSGGAAPNLELADGTFIGQRLAINMVADAGDGTLPVANFSNPTWITTSIVWDDVGDGVVLEWDGSVWNPVGAYTATIS